MPHIKVLKISGMTCLHCTAKMTNLLKSIPGVSNAKVNLLNEEAEVMLTSPVSDELFNTRITEAGYRLVSVK